MFRKKRNDADELVKLAGLRADEAINDMEYGLQKAKLIHDGNRPARRRRPWWNWVLAFAILVFCLTSNYMLGER
ncbi:hypothetical protein [Paraburkholderia sp. RL17-337-BIB-A]|jgi:hypothetical protein|uniref:hypothetical protein n=1 Tax=Paraburkholderia sp. RL17-337-BIB-A TaxID=3031636 RepID=UPI0038BCBAA2